MAFGFAGALLVLFSGSAWPAEPGPLPPATADGLFAFANHLRDEGDYDRAITEYRRLLFHFPTCPHADAARLEVPRCYARAERWQESQDLYQDLAAAFAGQPLGRTAAFERTGVLLASREFDAAASACDQFLADSPRAPEADEARWRLAWSFLLGHRFPEAERAFRAIQPPSPHAEAAGKLAEESGRLATRRRKSPLLAGILGIVPGLGHLYCGRTADGLTSLGVNALLGAGTASALSKGADAAGVVLGLLTGSFYGGSIFGGVTWAHRVNRATAQERVDALRREHGL